MYLFPVSDLIPDLGFALRADAEKAVENGLPHLKADFPPFAQFDLSVGLDDHLAIILMSFKSVGVPTGGEMDAEKFRTIKQQSGNARTYEELKSNEHLQEFFGWDRFLLVLDVEQASVDWHNAQSQMLAWLNDEPIRRAQEMNLLRVQAAIPQPPQFSFIQVQAAMWVLECENTMIQGTAFDLHPYGVVTNHHVVHQTTGMVAFRATEPSKRFPIKILNKNPVLDLAILEIEGCPSPQPLNADKQEVPFMAHVAVCGFPNFRLGDSGVLTPGLIIGTRTKSGVQRFLTNAPIVAGMSGGPAIGARGKVIGVCVSGAKVYSEVGDTEDHAIIPIAALDILD